MVCRPRMREYFNQVINVEDLLHPLTQQAGNALMVVGEEKLEQPMAYYYKMTEKDIKYMPPELTPDLDWFDIETADFKYQSVMLSVPEIQLLMSLVIEHSDLFVSKGYQQLVNFAQNIRKSTSHGEVFKDLDAEGKSANSGAVQYLVFIEEKLPYDIKISPSKHKSSSKVSTFAQISKVKDAVINLLCSLDSFAMFFANSDQTSLAHIVEFVLKFTYLFERRKSSMQGKVPIKILAQFIATQLPLLPENFRANGYWRLYQAISSEYQTRYQTLTHQSSQNKQILLVCKR